MGFSSVEVPAKSPKSQDHETAFVDWSEKASSREFAVGAHWKLATGTIGAGVGVGVGLGVGLGVGRGVGLGVVPSLSVPVGPGIGVRGGNVMTGISVGVASRWRPDGTTFPIVGTEVSIAPDDGVGESKAISPVSWGLGDPPPGAELDGNTYRTTRSASTTPIRIVAESRHSTRRRVVADGTGSVAGAIADRRTLVGAVAGMPRRASTSSAERSSGLRMPCSGRSPP